jgi:hypothetical protein
MRALKVVPGETALAFFTAENKSEKAITGVATYNVQPNKAGQRNISVFAFYRVVPDVRALPSGLLLCRHQASTSTKSNAFASSSSVCGQKRKLTCR